MAPNGDRVVLIGSGPIGRIARGASSQATALVRARAEVAQAQRELREAEAELASAESMREVGQSIAERLDERADDARRDAEAAARLYLAASQGDGASMSSMTAVFGAGNDLLAGLSGVARISQLAGDAEALGKLAEKRAAEAEADEERASEAWAAIDDVDVEDLEADVEDAEAEVVAARDDQSDLQSRVAASDLELLESIPYDSGQLSAQGWSAPVSGRITDGYGPRPNKPLAGVNEFHRGTDVAASCGTSVYAATSGVVIETSGNGGYGNWVLIEHGDGVSTGYAHLRDGSTVVAPGDSVAAGQLIGQVGSTGASTGCHLHFEVRLGGVAVDALPFLAARGVPIA